MHMLILSVLLSFPIAVIKYPNKSNLMREDFCLAHISECSSSWQASSFLITWHPQSGTDHDGCMLRRSLCPLLLSRNPSQGMVPPSVGGRTTEVNVINIILIGSLPGNYRRCQVDSYY